MMNDLSPAMQRAMRAAHNTTLTLLIKRGTGYATHFIGGDKFNKSVIEGLIRRGIMAHPHSSTGVILTDYGRVKAAALAADHEAIQRAGRNSPTARRLRAGMKRQMIDRHQANAAQQRREWRNEANAITADDLTPLTTRLPYAD
ncbi:MAG: hypothetical protein ACRDBL_09555 [Rhabdaerophilum sp.]